MRKNLLAIPILALLAVPALTACGSGSDARYVAMCADRNGNFLPDYMCDSPGGIYPQAVPFYMPWNTWHDTVEVHHHHYYSGERLSGGTLTRPSNRSGSVRVQSASNPSKVTLYSKGKQAGTPIKMNQDAKKVGTVTKAQKDSYKASYGSTGGKAANKSSFGSSSSKSFSSSSRRK